MVGTTVTDASSSMLLLKRKRDDTRLSDTKLDLSILDCPICCEALSSPIFQCDNGHLACSSCCPKLCNKCPSCALPIGHSRCRAMESVLRSIILPCPNAMFGCNKSFSYGKELIHEKECAFSQCSCPHPQCNYTGSYKDVYSHFHTHNIQGKQKIIGVFRDIKFRLGNSRIVMDDDKNGLLFVAQFFTNSHGVYVAMSCIAPPALEVAEFSCHISTKEPYTMTIENLKIKRTPILNVEFPKDDFMLVPSYFLNGEVMGLKISIQKLN